MTPQSWRTVLLILGLAATPAGGGVLAAPRSASPMTAAETYRTATPIRHLVVIFQENVSFDHYFATYPVALNPPGEPAFHAARGTPTVNGLIEALRIHNPNAAQPFRLGRNRAATCDQDHEYTDEQRAYNGGLLDRFVPDANGPGPGQYGKTVCHVEDVMGYFDGNTVTALWNYAQHFAMSDNHYGTVFGPSTPGALNLAAGNTHGATGYCNRPHAGADCKASEGTLETQGDPVIIEHTIIGDPQPEFDDCSQRDTASMDGPNIGVLLNAHGVTWGFFQGGFRPTAQDGGKVVCDQRHVGAHGISIPDYIPHHEPFQYYQSTANPHHLEAESPERIGENDRANHQYDLSDFWVAANGHHLPSVSILKAPAYQDGHAGYSDPLTEQRFLVETVNRLERLPEFRHMAIFIAYDDSDGWYDHVMPPILRGSATPADALSGPGMCGRPGSRDLPGRCGPGPRLPFLVISPYSRRNYVDHTVTEQASLLRFIEDNWQLGRLGGGSADLDAEPIVALFDFDSGGTTPPLFLDPDTGQPAR
jgi:phospholipase C